MAPSSKRVASGASTASGSPALLNATLLCAAVSFGLWLLVSRGQMSWPPSRLLGNLYTISGCLALVGPFVLARRSSEGGLGDLVWLTGGVLVWVTNLARVLQDGFRVATWATPMRYETLGYAMLAVIIAGWRIHGIGRSWSWTNVVGWVLGIFWVGMGLATLWPGAAVALRV